jgi:hypothetical protein
MFERSSQHDEAMPLFAVSLHRRNECGRPEEPSCAD